MTSILERGTKKLPVVAVAEREGSENVTRKQLDDGKYSFTLHLREA